MIVSGLGLGSGSALDEIREGDPRVEVAQREGLQRRTLALADVIAAALAVTVCVVGLAGLTLRPSVLLAMPMVVVIGKLLGVYDRDELLIHRATLDEAPRLLQLATLYTLLFSILQGAFVRGRLDAAALLALWISAFGFGILSRACARGLVRVNTTAERCFFVGSEASAARLASKLQSSGGRAVLAGRMSIDEVGHDDATAAAAELSRVVGELRIHRVVIEPSEAQPQTTLDFVREAKGIGARVSLLPRILEVVGSSIEIDDIHGLTLLGVRRFGLTRSSALVKRTLDLIGGSLALAAFSPLLVIAAVLIKLDTSGPVFYRQTRIGKDDAPFRMWKLRTMIVGADALKPSLHALNEADGLFKIADDRASPALDAGCGPPRSTSCRNCSTCSAAT